MPLMLFTILTVCHHCTTNIDRSRRSATQNCGPLNPHSLALAEVVTYIEEYKQLGDAQHHVFKLTDLKQLYSDHVEKLGGDTTKHIHSTRLVQKLQEYIPSLQSHNSKSGTLLTFKKVLVMLC